MARHLEIVGEPPAQRNFDALEWGLWVTRGSAAPTTGNHARGEIVLSTAPSSGGFIGWICTAAGAPGTWKTFGAIS